VRVKPDGILDADFQHGLSLVVSINRQLDGVVVVSGFLGEHYGAWRILPDGLAPGTTLPLEPEWRAPWGDSTAQLEDGRWLYAFYRCRVPSRCNFGASLAGSALQLSLETSFRQTPWFGRTGVSAHGQDAWILGPDFLSKYTFPAGPAAIGLSESGFFGRPGSLSIPLQRTGTLSGPATVTFSIAPVTRSGVLRNLARTGTVHFEPLAPAAAIQLAKEHVGEGSAVREFELRLEEASGAALSSLRVARILVFDPPIMAEGLGPRLHLLPISSRSPSLALLHASGGNLQGWGVEGSADLRTWKTLLQFPERISLPLTTLVAAPSEDALFVRLRRGPASANP
jgi:hypothetical protein